MIVSKERIEHKRQRVIGFIGAAHLTLIVPINVVANSSDIVEKAI